MEDFILYKTFPSGGTVSLMTGLDKTSSDYNDLLSIACFFARKGQDVRILRQVHYKDPLYSRVFRSLLGSPYERKCPDLLIDGIFYEYESYKRPFRSKKISHMIKRGFEQSNRIVIDNNKGASDRFIINGVYNRINDKAFKHEIMELLLYEKGRVRTLYKRKSGRELGSPRSTNP